MKNSKKIAFIICTNNIEYLEECCWYISNLYIPKGYETDVISITDAESMTSAYNEAMKSSDAKYKIYMHQDVFICNKNLIVDILKIFENPEIGMIGCLGTDRIVSDAYFHLNWNRGNCFACNSEKSFEIKLFDKSKKYLDGITEVNHIDGMIMITQYDLKWDEVNYDGWHFYDVSQCDIFRKSSYKIVVPVENAWIMHDSGYCSYSSYEKYRKKYCDMNTEYSCEKYDEILLYTERMKKELEPINEQLIFLIEKNEYEKAFEIAKHFQEHLVANTLLSNIKRVLEICVAEEKVGRRTLATNYQHFSEMMSCYNKVKFLLRRIEFGYGEQCKEEICRLVLNEKISVEMLFEVLQHTTIRPKSVWDEIRKMLE